MKFLLHSHFPDSFALSMQAVAAELIHEGHSVVWLAHPDSKDAVLSSRATFSPTRAVALVDSPLLEAHVSGTPWDASPASLQHHKDRLLAQVADYRDILCTFRADVLVVDVFPWGAQALHDLGEIPTYATIGTLPLYTSGPRAPLPVSGLTPPTRRSKLVKNCVRQLYRQWVQLPLGLVVLLNRQRRTLGLPSLPLGQAVEHLAYSPFCHLQASAGELEFLHEPRPDKSNVVYCGPLVRIFHGSDLALPAWMDGLHYSKRVVGVSQTSLAADPFGLIETVVDALEGYPDILLVVLTPKFHQAMNRLGQRNNVMFACGLPSHLLLPKMRCVITDGGYDGVAHALSHGIPVICAGRTEHNRDVAARVQYCGVGIDLKSDSPTPTSIEISTQLILSCSRFAEKARALSRSISMLGGARRAVYELEKLANETQSKRELLE